MIRLKGKTILIVDDEPDIRELLTSELMRYHCRTIEAESGHKALDLVREMKPDLVITDLRMPNGDGVELLEKIKQRDPRVPPVIVMTAGSGSLSDEELKKKGASFVLRKPFQLEAAMAEIAGLV